MKLQDKYPDNCFEHFLAMFNEEPNKETIKQFIKMAVDFEGVKYLKNVLSEMKQAETDNDWQLFINLSLEFEKEFTIDDFLLMKNEIIEYLSKKQLL